MLVLTRKAGTVIYGGTRLGKNVEDSYDHKFTTTKIVDNLRERYAIVCVDCADGHHECFTLDADDDEFVVDDVKVALIGIRCLAGVPEGDNLIARIGIEAPRDYRIIRDDANKKYL